MRRPARRPRAAGALAAAGLALAGLAAACGRAGDAPAPAPVLGATGRDWGVVGGDPGNGRYSALRGIDRGNVGRLRAAWVYHTGDAGGAGGAPGRGTEIQATPVVVDGVLYATSPRLRVFALDAATGRERWRFDPPGADSAGHVNRGVAVWTGAAAAAGAAAAGEVPNAAAPAVERRVFVTVGRRLWALDARTGRPAAGFGDSGWVDLAAGLGRDVTGQYLVATSPGAVYRDLLVQGTRVAEGDGAAPGHVRAFDVRTGRVRWTFHTIPRPGEPGHDSWPADAWRTAGGANAWAGMAVDTARGLVFVPTGSATPDFYGGARPGANLFANSLLALDAATGRRRWHFQTVHHDLWDRDLPAPPNLLTVRRDGRRVDAVAQITKSGFVFLFDRATGAPLFPVEERAVAASDLPGERAWPTQPVPLRPAPFARQRLTEADLTDRTPAARAAVLERFRTLRAGGLFTPPSLAGTVVFPGLDGGGEWGGAAVDRRAGVLYVNGSDVPWIARMVPSGAPTVAAGTGGAARGGAAVYAAACAGCHKPDRRGDGDRVPSLVALGARRSAGEVAAVVARGRGFMPSFAALPAAERAAVVAYVLGRPAPRAGPGGGSPHAREPAARTAGGPPPAPYRLAGYERWRDPDGYPAVKPPWGTLSAIDLNTGAYRWRIPLGDHPELARPGEAPAGRVPTGTEQYGGPIVTAGGLVFIGATHDARFRAFDAASGALLWQALLPAPAYATPSTYEAGGRQFVVIAAGGGKLGSPSGDAYVAFALPDPAAR